MIYTIVVIIALVAMIVLVEVLHSRGKDLASKDWKKDKTSKTNQEIQEILNNIVESNGKRYCKYCGAELEDGKSKCDNCGATNKEK